MSRTIRLWIVLAANLALVGAVIGVGLSANSLGVYAEGVDYLMDAAAIAVSIIAVYLASRPPTPRHPAGFSHVTRIAAFVNAGWLLVITAVVAAEGIRRLVNGVHQVRGLPVLIVSGVAALTMIGAALFLGGDVDGDDDEEDLNLRAVLLDTAADGAAAAGVAATGAVIYATGGWYWLDPSVALVIAVVVGVGAVRLLARIWRVSQPSGDPPST